MARGSELDERATLVAARCSKPLSDSFQGYNAISVLDIVGTSPRAPPTFPKLTRIHLTSPGRLPRGSRGRPTRVSPLLVPP
jgi:hypothetical protein